MCVCVCVCQAHLLNLDLPADDLVACEDPRIDYWKCPYDL